MTFAAGMLVGIIIASVIGALVHPTRSDRGRADISAALRRGRSGEAK